MLNPQYSGTSLFNESNHANCCIDLLYIIFRGFFTYVPVDRLKQRGIRTVLLSGDREEAVAIIAKSVGIENEFVNASLTPRQKSDAISSLQSSGHRVAMVIFLLVGMDISCRIMFCHKHQIWCDLYFCYLPFLRRGRRGTRVGPSGKAILFSCNMSGFDSHHCCIVATVSPCLGLVKLFLEPGGEEEEVGVGG